MIKVRCPECSHVATVEDKYGGGTGTCLRCKTEMEIPLAKNRDGKIDVEGAWCSHCSNRHSEKKIIGLPVLLTLAVVSAGVLAYLQQYWFAFGGFLVGLALVFFLPREWQCKECSHRWRG